MTSQLDLQTALKMLGTGFAKVENESKNKFEQLKKKILENVQKDNLDAAKIMARQAADHENKMLCAQELQQFSKNILQDSIRVVKEGTKLAKNDKQMSKYLNTIYFSAESLALYQHEKPCAVLKTIIGKPDPQLISNTVNLQFKIQQNDIDVFIGKMVQVQNQQQKQGQTLCCPPSIIQFEYNQIPAQELANIEEPLDVKTTAPEALVSLIQIDELNDMGPVV